MRAAVATLLTLAACSPRAPGNDVDIAGAAHAARASSENYIGGIAPPGPTPKARPVPTSSPTPVARPGASPDGAQAAAATVERYFALIEQGKYAAAWALWDHDGAASELTAEAFAASFDKYARYHAVVGTPDRVDGGAGQRYVTVPVRVYGSLRTGRPFAMEGPLTLHRIADIDGATEAQRAWRISDSSLKPRPSPASPAKAAKVTP